MALPDHLVLAARDLATGAAWLESRLGVALQPGGRHARMGTHNRLLGLGEDLYLELIAVDPQAAPPGRARWFGLDRAASLPPERPRLIHWVARSEDIEREARACGEALGEILALERGEFRWRITVPEDGHLPGDGLVPSLIQWDVAEPPARRLPDRGCRLMKLEAFHPAPEPVRDALAALDLGARLDLHPASPGEPAQLVAYLRTPNGLVELD